MLTRDRALPARALPVLLIAGLLGALLLRLSDILGAINSPLRVLHLVQEGVRQCPRLRQVPCHVLHHRGVVSDDRLHVDHLKLKVVEGI